LPFLAIVLVLSYIKQAFNYVFIAFEKQNLLLKVNLFGIALGLGIGIWLVKFFDIRG